MRPTFRYFVLCLTLLTVALAFTPVPAAADEFALNVAFCTTGCAPGTGPWGTVTLVNDPTVTTNIDVTVSLNSPLVFHDQGLTSFVFNGPAGLTSSNFTVLNPGNTTWTFQSPAANADGAGSFMYGFECAAGPNHCTDPTNLFEFQISGLSAGTLLSAFETTDNGTRKASNTDFAANVANQDGSGCTGMIGGGNGTSASTPSGGGSSSCTPTTTVPEPASLALLGTGLLALGGLARRRWRK